MDAEIERLHALALRFRCAIDVADRSDWGVEFKGFPRGACGDTSQMLGQYLADQGCGAFDYVSGISGTGMHAWLEQGDIVVDITGDQFPGFDHRIYVGRDRGWHSRYSADRIGPARLDMFGPDAAWNLRRIYQRINDYLNQPSEAPSHAERSKEAR